MLLAIPPVVSFTSHLLPGLAGMYASGMVANLIFAGQKSASPGYRALLHWLPIAVTVLVSLYFRWDHVAVSLIFGSSICLLTCAIGALGLVAPIGPAPEHFKTVWRFLPAATLLIFVIGFKGIFRPMHGLVMLLEGIVILGLWRQPPADIWRGPELPADVLVPNNLVRCLLLAVVIGVAGFCAYQAGIGTEEFRHAFIPINSGLMASFVWSLVLVNPIMHSGRKPSRVGQTWLPMTSQLGVVFLNLCVLIPIVTITPYIRHWHEHPEVIGKAMGVKINAVKSVSAATTGPSSYLDTRGVKVLKSTGEPPTFLPDTSEMISFPLVSWRIDCVVMLIVSLMLLPVSSGKWNLSRIESACLLAGYAVYLFAGILFGG